MAATDPIARSTRALCLAGACALSSHAAAQPDHGPAPDRPDVTAPQAQEPQRRYTLWNPTPPDRRRPLSADRPDATESPRTVDPGAVQIELSFVDYTFNEAGGTQTHTLSIAPMNLKLGLDHSTDLQLLFDPYTDTQSSGPSDPDGVGTIGVRVKRNIFGNDAGPIALGVMPFVVFPSGDRDISIDRVEWGLIVPVAADIAPGWGVGAQIELARVDDGQAGADTLLSHTLVLSRELTDRAGAFIEYIGRGNIDQDEYSPLLSAGATYQLDRDTALDLGVVVGLDDDSTDDVSLFMGITKRF